MAGGIFLLLAAVGVTRMPDLYTRMQTATKAATLGVGCTLLAVAFHFHDLGTTARALAIVLFVFLTAPVGAHMIGRAAYLAGVPLWEKTEVDEMQGYRAAALAGAGRTPPPPGLPPAERTE